MLIHKILTFIVINLGTILFIFGTLKENTHFILFGGFLAFMGILINIDKNIENIKIK